MEEINISKLTPKVLTRLAKGLPVRIKGGNDVKLVVDTNQAKKMMKNFMKGKGVTKSFSEDEIEQNAIMEGKGIFGKRFDKFLKRIGKKAGIDLKKTVYKVGDAIKPFAKKAIKTGLTSLATAITPILAETPASILIPSLPSAVNSLSKTADNFLDKPSDFGVGGGLYAGGGFYSREGTYHPNTALTHRHNFNTHKQLHNYLNGSGLYTQSHMRGTGHKEIMNSKEMKKLRKIMNPFGGGQLQRNIPREEIASIGIGGNLLSKFEQHPAIRSQPCKLEL